MAKVLLIDIDSRIPNLALMKLSTYWKGEGFKVELNQSTGRKPDIVQAAVVFTKNKARAGRFREVYPEMQIGGTGWDTLLTLQPEQEKLMPDYSLYNADTSLGFTTRGCIRKCPFCFVPEKEGGITVWQDWRGFHDPAHEKIMLLDNNLLAAPREWWWEQLKTLGESGLEVQIPQNSPPWLTGMM